MFLSSEAPKFYVHSGDTCINMCMDIKCDTYCRYKGLNLTYWKGRKPLIAIEVLQDRFYIIYF